MFANPCFHVAVSFALALVVTWRSLDAVAAFQLTILHTNDVHARFEQYTLRDGRCPSSSGGGGGNCYGGLARRATLVKRFRREANNVLLLDAGDQYQGTPWFYYYKGKAACHFMNDLHYDAMSLGNHEFDNDIDGLVPFLRNVTFPVVCANINFDQEPKLNGLINRSSVITVGRRRVGVVGYLTKDTPDLSRTGKLRFEDEVTAVQAEVSRLKKHGIDIIIALGHAGFKVDKDIAAKVKGVDIVIGGHTNTFLYTGDPPSTEKPEGPYPLVITQPDGHRVPVLEAYAFGKYLGYFQATFDDGGRLVNWTGNPILLNESVEQDADVVAELSVWGAEVQASFAAVVGASTVFLNGTFPICRLHECVLGNLITDAMVDHFQESGKWPNLRIAVLNGGGIRSSIEEGNITYESVLAAMPFGNTIDIVELLGKDLTEVLEFSIANYSTQSRHGKFLQVSGLRVTYDLTKGNGKRVRKVEVVCGNCSDRRFYPIDGAAVYQVAMPSYLVGGGDGYALISKRYKRHYNLGDVDSDILIEFLKRYSPISPHLDDRIILIRRRSSITSSSGTIIHARWTLLTVVAFHCTIQHYRRFLQR